MFSPRENKIPALGRGVETTSLSPPPPPGGKIVCLLSSVLLPLPAFPLTVLRRRRGRKNGKIILFLARQCKGKPLSDTRFRERLFSLLLLHLSETQEKLRKIYSVSPKENVGDVKYLLHCRLLFLCSNCFDGLFPKNMAVTKDCC